MPEPQGPWKPDDLEKRRGNGTIMAIDVAVQDDPRVDARMARLSAGRTIRGYVRAGMPSMPGIGDIPYRAGHIGGLTRRGCAIAQSGQYRMPPVAALALMAYQRAAEIAEVEYRYAMQEIGPWDKPAALG